MLGLGCLISIKVEMSRGSWAPESRAQASPGMEPWDGDSTVSVVSA